MSSHKFPSVSSYNWVRIACRRVSRDFNEAHQAKQRRVMWNSMPPSFTIFGALLVYSGRSYSVLSYYWWTLKHGLQTFRHSSFFIHNSLLIVLLHSSSSQLIHFQQLLRNVAPQWVLPIISDFTLRDRSRIATSRDPEHFSINTFDSKGFESS